MSKDLKLKRSKLDCQRITKLMAEIYFWEIMIPWNKEAVYILNDMFKLPDVVAIISILVMSTIAMNYRWQLLPKYSFINL